MAPDRSPTPENPPEHRGTRPRPSPVAPDRSPTPENPPEHRGARAGAVRDGAGPRTGAFAARGAPPFS
jgi:hypothetical protein